MFLLVLVSRKHPFAFLALIVALVAYAPPHERPSRSHHPNPRHHHPNMPSQRWVFKAQHGFFTHDSDPESWDFRATTLPFLGISPRQYTTDPAFDPSGEKTQWQRLEHFVRAMNAANPAQQRWRIIYLIRHGEGVHNVKEKEVGRAEWGRHWAKVCGDGSAIWEDAELTSEGVQQAEKIAMLFRTGEVPLPDVIFSSPLRRCLRTTEIVYGDVLGRRRRVVKEKLRERLGVHTCDRRSGRSYIASAYPAFEIEDGFTEEDELWKADVRESLDEHIVRATQLLETLFEHEDDGIIMSLTAHSGAIMALFGATGWRKIPVAAGAVYPLLVVAEKDYGET
ncbi:phosphoglycerate mutase-like protein [Karstenula rhodostoma CBS 690.94]|uniref:Phosphoglycerate mutase-like protein n=1 Tax=Karstenula rhodostoma CBS 690.94 TaxID=1392251 RepID=A0A9P4P5R7_9PLEO|nr:phosphoglycerate mutase-like protein [Karstenula rhodostoma CBS 690.94]